MYEANGIDLQSSEYEEIRLLVSAARNNENVTEIANMHLFLDMDKHQVDRDYCDLYNSLYRKGLISGLPADNAFIFLDLTRSAFDFVDDYDAIAKQEERERRHQRRHDYRIALLGVLGGLFSGAFGSWIYNIAGSLIHH